MLLKLTTLAVALTLPCFAEPASGYAALKREVAALESRLSTMLEHDIHEWEADLHKPVKWQPLQIQSATARNAKIEIAADGSLRASGAGEAAFIIQAVLPQQGATAFRIEFLPNADGQKVSAGIGELEIRPAKDSPALTVITASASVENPGSEIAKVVDGNPATGWSVSPDGKISIASAFQLSKPLERAEVVTFFLRNKAPAHGPRSFRIYATSHRPPVLELPDSIRDTLALEPSERTEKQRRELERYYRTHSPDCVKTEQQLAAKRAALLRK